MCTKGLHSCELRFLRDGLQQTRRFLGVPKCSQVIYVYRSATAHDLPVELDMQQG